MCLVYILQELLYIFHFPYHNDLKWREEVVSSTVCAFTIDVNALYSIRKFLQALQALIIFR